MKCGAFAATVTVAIYALADLASAQTTTPAPSAAASDWRNVPPKRCSRAEKILANGDNAECDAREVAASRKEVGDLLAAGKCDHALKAALGTGDLSLAREVRDYCATARKPANGQ
jgi:hypothetical protein